MVRLTPTLNDTTAMPAKRDYKGHGHCFVFGSNFIFTVIMVILETVMLIADLVVASLLLFIPLHYPMRR